MLFFFTKFGLMSRVESRDRHTWWRSYSISGYFHSFEQASSEFLYMDLLGLYTEIISKVVDQKKIPSKYFIHWNDEFDVQFGSRSSQFHKRLK